MGWFDKEATDENAQSAPESRHTAAPLPSPSPSPPPVVAGSTIGKRVHINGTIVSDEDLTILGRVDGTIHARQTLLIAAGAEVKAVVNARKVVLDGAVDGDVHGAETVVLGATASLVGNITSPSLQIHEGAFVKGSISMKKQGEAARAAVPARAATKAAGTAKAADSKSTPEPKVAVAADLAPARREPVGPGRGA